MAERYQTADQQTIVELKKLLRAAQQRVDAERKRADAAVESSRRAWALGLEPRKTHERNDE